MEKALAEKGTIVLSVALHADLSQVQGDPNLLQRALLNLVMNAAKLPTARVCPLRDFQHERADAGISIADSGPGMDDATMEKAFEAFFHHKETGNRTGIVHRANIVESHNGSITLERCAAGARRSPCCFPQPGPEYEAEILIVEDEEKMRRVLEIMLSQDGYASILLKTA